MLLGSKRINEEALRKASHSIEGLRAFSDGLVPKPFDKVQEIIMNQRYYTGLFYRSLKGVRLYKGKGELIEDFLTDVRICGKVNTIADIEDLLLEVDVNLLLTALFEEELKAYRKEVSNSNET